MKMSMTISVVLILRLSRQSFFYERYFKHLKHKKKHLRNIQPNISISKKNISSNI